MRLWLALRDLRARVPREVRALGAAWVVLVLMQCGGEPDAADDALPLPDRVDRDAGEDDSPNVSGDAPVAACAPAKPFGAPVRLREFDAATHRSVPRLSA